MGYYTGELRFWLGWAQEVAGDHAAAHESWRQARTELERFLKEQPENQRLIEDLALTNMGLGDKGAALALVERALEALPIEKDAFRGPSAIDVLARVAAQTGEPDRAIAALQKLLSIPYAGLLASTPLTPALLRLDPMFDPLRNDPRFQKLCEEETKVNSRNFFAELKRRNVFRMAGLYLFGAWLLTQVASTLLPAFDAPSWALRGLIITLALGFIPAVIFSWVFEEAAVSAQKDAADWARQLIVSCARWGQKRVPESDAALSELIAKVSETGAYQIAEVYAYRNDKDYAFEWLERARRQRDAGLPGLRADTLLPNLHDDPRWDAFLRKMGLADDQLK